MVGLIAEGINPTLFGFDTASEDIPLLYTRMIGQKKITSEVLKKQWCEIKDRIKANRKVVRRLPFWKDVKWILKVDFQKIEKFYIPKEKRIRQYFAKFRFYQFLHSIKKKFK